MSYYALILTTNCTNNFIIIITIDTIISSKINTLTWCQQATTNAYTKYLRLTMTAGGKIYMMQNLCEEFFALFCFVFKKVVIQDNIITVITEVLVGLTILLFYKYLVLLPRAHLFFGFTKFSFFFYFLT